MTSLQMRAWYDSALPVDAHVEKSHCARWWIKNIPTLNPPENGLQQRVPSTLEADDIVISAGECNLAPARIRPSFSWDIM